MCNYECNFLIQPAKNLKILVVNDVIRFVSRIHFDVIQINGVQITADAVDCCDINHK